MRRGTKSGTWIRNPIPACYGPRGGKLGGSPSPCRRPQFPAPIPGLFGFGPTACISAAADALTNFSMMMAPCVEHDLTVEACVQNGAQDRASPSLMELACLGLARSISLYSNLILDVILGLDCLGLALTWPQVQYNLEKYTNCSAAQLFSWVERFNFNIVDTLSVPEAKGEYVRAPPPPHFVWLALARVPPATIRVHQHIQ